MFFFQFGFNAYFPEINSRKQLSPQQQGHILSDIQQHQSRFQQLHHQNLVKNQARHKDVDIVRNAPLSSNNFQQPSFQSQFSSADFINNQNLVDNQNVLLRQNQINNFGNRNQDPRNQKTVQATQFNDNSFEANFGRQLPILPEQNQNLPAFSRLEQQQQQQQPVNQFNNQPLVNSAQQLLNNPAIANGFNGNNAPLPTIPTNNPNINSLHTQSSFLHLPTNQPNIIPQQRPLLPAPPTRSIPIDPVQQKEFLLKQQIIDKHNQFVEKQYEKALKKAQIDHQQWLTKQLEHKTTIYQTLATIDNPKAYNNTHSRSRYLGRKEFRDFEKALENYWIEHPTTTTTTTTEATTTTNSPRNIFEQFKQQLLLANRKQEDIEVPATGIKSTTENNIEELLGESTKDYTDGLSTKFLPTALPSTKSIPIELLKHAQKITVHKNDLLRQPQIILTENPELEITKNFTAREISLANSENLTSNSNLLLGTSPFKSLKLDNETLQKFILQSSSTTVKPPKAVLEELTKGVLPPGTDFEVIKHDQNGGLHEVGKLPSSLTGEKKVTFVLLEEQHDGSFKVQGVKGNTDSAKESANVDAILKRIKDGDIKLPPQKNIATEPKPSVTFGDIDTQSTRSATTSYKNWVSLKTVSTKKLKADITTTPQPTKSSIFISDTSQTPFSPTLRPFTSSTFFPSSERQRSAASISSTFSYTTTPKPTTQAFVNTTKTYKLVNNLIDVLKKNELYAMAKFLKQSGLDTILNETGPYSIFVPTDKAFRLMLIQLGGPQKAEEKFKDNPRLLSGVSLNRC